MSIKYLSCSYGQTLHKKMEKVENNLLQSKKEITISIKLKTTIMEMNGNSKN